MVRTITVVLMLVLVGLRGSAFAAADDRKGTTTPDLAPLGADVDWSLKPIQIEATVSRGCVLPALYVSLAGLQAYDAYTTTIGLRGGATEANTIMRTAAGNPTALWVVKGGVSVATILISERLWKRGRRGQAIAMMAISNGMMAVVAAHNSSVLRRIQ